MTDEISKTSEMFLEISSEQRLGIIFYLLEEKAKLTTLAKKLDATSSEVHRNLNRLIKADIIRKDSDGFFELSTFGKTISTVVPTVSFFMKNKNYLKNHSFGNLPEKFVQRVGSLSTGKQVKGITKILEKWKSMTDDAEKYIHGILYEEPIELIEPIVKKAKKGINVKSIFSDTTIIPDGRKEILERLGVSNLIEHGYLERKIKKDINVAVLLNEKESCVMFPFSNGETDITKMIYGTIRNFTSGVLIISGITGTALKFSEKAS